MAKRGTFVLEISVGDDSMGRPEHVAKALQELARDLEGGRRLALDGRDDPEGDIFDANGNRVGGWKVSPKWRPAEDEIECSHCGDNVREKDSVADPDQKTYTYCVPCAEQLGIG